MVALSLVAEVLHPAPAVEQTWQDLVEAAGIHVPGFDHVGIATMQATGPVETRACTSGLVVALDEIQHGSQEGPCSLVLQGPEEISVSVLHDEQRWPWYVPQARAAGVRSQMAVKLDLDRGTRAGINFYSTTSYEVSSQTQALARLFAAYASSVLAHVHERDTLNEALKSRKVIGQAIGIVMERYDMNEDRAFAFLARGSSHANVKLRILAQRFVDEQNAR